MLNTINSRTTPIKLVIASIIILLIAGLWGWYRLIYTSPSGVFDRMVSNSLSTVGVAKKSIQAESGQQLDQTTQLVASPNQRVYSKAILKQGADGGTVITTDTIGTTSADYVKYASIVTNQKTADGKKFDFSPVLGVWGKSDAKDSSSGGAQTYNQTVLGVLPIGSITANQRQQLVAQIKKDQVYSVDYGSVKKSRHAGRPVYGYDVSIKPAAYVAMLKTFARDIGLKQLESIDPSQYADSAPLKFSFDVDVWSGNLAKITYKDSKRSENYSSYGVSPRIDIPVKTIPVAELQGRLQQIQ